MTTAELVAKARIWVGYTTTAFDDEITQTINACILDMRNGGVVYLELSDELIQMAIKLYLKAFFRESDKSERYERQYEFLKKSLENSSDYNRERETDES